MLKRKIVSDNILDYKLKHTRFNACKTKERQRGGFSGNSYKNIIIIPYLCSHISVHNVVIPDRGSWRPPPRSHVGAYTIKRAASVCPPLPRFDFTLSFVEPRSKIMFLSTSCQSGAKQTTNLKSPNLSFRILPFIL